MINSLDSLTTEELQALRDNIHLLSPTEQLELLEMIEELEKRERAQKAANSLIEFCKYIMPEYKVGPHHRRLARILEDMAYGRETRTIVNIAPRFGKSQITSIFFPAWFIGHFPEKKIMIVSHTAELAVDFGRKVRNVVSSEKYAEVFPGVSLAKDSKSAGRWSTNKDGEFFACICPDTKVKTTKGVKRAGAVVVGDRLLNAGEPVTVQQVYNSEHSETYIIQGVKFSAKHPIWTMNRGWVYAEDVRPEDVLCVESIYDSLKAKLRGLKNGYLEYTGSCGVQAKTGGKPTRESQETQEELRAYSNPEGLGWLRNKAARLIAKRSGTVREPQGGAEMHLACARRAAEKLQGFLLGVRRAGEIIKVEHDPKPFVNFLTDGDHTFYAGGVLTHNCGVGGALAGRGADLLVIDDPHNEQEVLNGNYEVFDRAYDWYAYGARTRLMPGGAVAIVMTRWAKNDLAGKLVDDMAKNPGADQWNVVEFPALLERKDAKPDAEGKDRWKSLWPEQWSVEALLTTKASMPTFQWNAQYMQNPTSEEAAIIKREWWRKWEKLEPPPCNYIIMSLDAAAEKNNRADYTSLTTWGVFTHTDYESGISRPAIILLNSIKKRLEFPELKKLAKQEYVNWEPDWFVVEKKSSGTPLYQELRRAGIPVQEFTPHRGTGDKFARLNSVADIFAAGLVWYPVGHRWAEEVVDEVCGFPAMPNDDIVDTTVMALMRFRNGGFVSLDTDDWEDEDEFVPVRAAYY